MSKHYIKDLLKLSLPIIAGQLGQMLIVAGDVYIATMHSTKTVAAIGVASGFINPIFLFGIGLMMGISPILAQRRGQGQDDTKDLFSIVVYAALAGLLMTLIMLAVLNYTDLFGVEQSLLPSINAYIEIIAWSFPFGIIFQGVKEFLQSFEKVFIPNLLAIIAVILNLFINYLLVFGWGQFTGLGEMGLAYASLGIRFILCLSILIYAKNYFISFKFAKEFVIKILSFAFPIAFMFFLEVLAFCTVSVLSGQLGIVSAATNNIIVTLASLAFMIPLSLASAIGVKVGHAYGLKDEKGVYHYIKASILITSVYILCSSTVFFFMPNFLMRFMTQDPLVIELGVKLLLIVAFFQLADGFQVTLSGILRGLDDTKTSFHMVLIGYWIIGLPVGYYLTFYQAQGARGLWVGLALALFLVAVTLSFVLVKRFRQFKQSLS